MIKSHFNKNKLSGPIPSQIFDADMVLIHVLFDGNQLTGRIPSTIGSVKTLETLRLDRNALEGEVPSTLNRLTSLSELYLGYNELSGALPDLSGMSSLTYVDLSNNSFQESDPPPWFSTLPSLSTIVMEFGTLKGKLPQTLFGLSGIQTVRLKNNNLNDTLFMGDSIGGQLELVDLQNNKISNVTLSSSYKQELELYGNPVCDQTLENSPYCQVQQSTPPYSTSLPDCGTKSCRPDQKPSPLKCGCAYPYEDDNGGGIGVGGVVGIAVGCTLLVIVLIVLVVYAIQQKKRAEKAISQSKPFGSWAPSTKDSGGAPQLKGARWFSYDELKKSTSKFSETNQIGSGGYGKVYRGVIPGGQTVAIKKAQQGSTQGGLEFKTEIELLSRVHHKNLVGLVGFCFEQGEQMLVYEYMPNGTLRESLSGKSEIHLDWKRRLRVALGAARGLAYLHEHADPPIIHRDVKSTNILLDENLTAKVADFGLSKLVSDSEKGHVSTQVKGTLGYLDPEYYMTQQLTDKSDVYSFGVVMLELITAKLPIVKGKYIVREVRLVMDMTDEEECGLRELLDPNLKDSLLTGFGRFIQLAMQCVEESAAERPTMSDVVKILENILKSDGMHTSSTSNSSSANEFANVFGSTPGVPVHPYTEGVLKRNESDAFEYTGGYDITAKFEPK